VTFNLLVTQTPKGVRFLAWHLASGAGYVYVRLQTL
jgi:hypothetical protein